MEGALPPVVAVLRSNISQFRAGMAEARGEMAKVEGSSAKMNAAISRAGKGSALAIAGIAAYSVHLAGNFQQATNVLVTAAGETQAGLAVVRDGIKSVGLETGVSFGQLEAGAYVLEKAGYRGANAVQMLRVASQGAREENASLGVVVNAMTSIMASYHLKTSDSVRVMNALKTAAGEAKTTMEDYAGALSTVLPIASAAHISFADVAGSFATLTQHGTSAQEATQELASTIRMLLKPSQVQATAMQQLGLTVNDVSGRLGERGLTGTLELLYQAILRHMGPGGLVLLNAFNQSKTAAQDAAIMLGNMPPAVQKIAAAYRDGSITMKEFRQEIRGSLTPAQANLLKQYAALEDQARGFSSQIKSGSPAAQTFAAVLQQVTGGAIGLNTALQITGENMAGTKARVEAVQKSFNDSGRDVEGWKTTMRNVNTALGEAKNALEIVAMDLGNVLIPAVRTASTFIAHHQTLVEGLATVFGVVLVAATVAWVSKLAWGAAQATVHLLQIIGKTALTGASWRTLAVTTETSTAQGAAAVAASATEEETALTAVGARILTLEEQFWGLATTEARSSAAGAAAIARNAAAAEGAMAGEAAAAEAAGGRIATAMAGAKSAMAGLAAAGVFAADAYLVPKAINSLTKIPSLRQGLASAQEAKFLYGDFYNKHADPAARAVLDARRGDIIAALSGKGSPGKLKTALDDLVRAIDNRFSDRAGSTSDNADIRDLKTAVNRVLHPVGVKRHPGSGASGSIDAVLKQLSYGNGVGAAGGSGLGGSASGGAGGLGSKKKTDPLAARRQALADLVASQITMGHQFGLDAAKAKAGSLTSDSARADQQAAQSLLAHAKELEKTTRGTKLHTSAVRDLVRAQKDLAAANKLVAETDAQARAAQAEQHRRDIMDNMFAIGLISNQAEEADLTKRMEGLEKYSDEWTRLYQERQRLIDEDTKAQLDAQQQVTQAVVDAAQQQADVSAATQIGSVQSMLAMLNPGTSAGMAMLQATFTVDGQALFTALQPQILRYQNRNGSSGVVAA